MPIPTDNPITIPASEEKQFDSVWISELRIYAPNLNDGGLSMTLTPFNGETGEIADGKLKESIVIRDLWDLVANVPEVETAMGAIFLAVPAIKEYIKSKETVIE